METTYESAIDDLVAVMNQAGDAIRCLGVSAAEATSAMNKWNEWWQSPECTAMLEWIREPMPPPWWQRAIWGIVGWPEDL